MIVYLVILLLAIAILLAGNGYFYAAVALGAAEAGFGDQVIGLLMAGYFLGVVLGAYLIPVMIRWAGHIRTFVALVAVVAATAVAHYLFVDPWVWGMLRLLAGIAVVGVYLVIESWLSEGTLDRQRGRVFGAYMMVTGIALGLGQFLIMADPRGGPIGFGLVALLFCIGLLPVALTRQPEPDPPPIPWASLGLLYRASLLGLVGTLCAGLVGGALWSLGALFGHRMGLTEVQIPLLMAAIIFGGIVLQYPFGVLSNRRDRRTVLTAAAFAAAVAALAVAALVSLSVNALLVAALLFGAVSFALYPLSVTHTHDNLDRAQTTMASRGLLLVYGVGAVLGPILAGQAMVWLGPRGLFFYCALVLLLLGAFGLYRRYRRLPSVAVTEQRPFVAMIPTSQAAGDLHPHGSPRSP